jgi:hypothetical protein
MRQSESELTEPVSALSRWKLRDCLAASTLFLASAAVVLWQNAHLCVLWDSSYTLETSFRIAVGQMPYRDFPLVHSPLTFLIQAALMRFTGRVFFHHVLYAAIVNGLATLCAWRIILRTLRGRMRGAWPVSLLLAAPLIPLGVYSILPFPSYDCDTAFSLLIVLFLLQRLAEKSSVASASRPHFFLAGTVLPLPLFFKQNIGLPFLAAAFALIFLLLFWQRLRGSSASQNSSADLQVGGKDLRSDECSDKYPAGAKDQHYFGGACGTTEVVPCYKRCNNSSFCKACPIALLVGALTTLTFATLLLHFTVGVHNYLHWTIQFAAERRLPGLQPMLDLYAEPSLLWWLPCIAVAFLFLRVKTMNWVAHPFHPERSRKNGVLNGEMGGIRGRYFRSASVLLLLAAPFLWTLLSFVFSADPEDRAASLLALWPLLLILSAVLSLWNFCRRPSLRTGIPILILAAMQGTFLSQQLWGSTYAIWPLLMLLMAEMIVFLDSIETTPATANRLFLAPSLAAIIAATLLVCGGLYTVSEERLNYAQLPDSPALHSTIPALQGMAVSGPFLPEFEELLRFSSQEISSFDGLILIPGEDPFYFATGRTPQFPVLLFDNATDPLSTPALLVAEAERRPIRWLIVKRNLQIKEDVTPRREATLQALQQIFLPYRKLAAYDIYRRP